MFAFVHVRANTNEHDRVVKYTIMESKVYDHVKYTILRKYTILTESIRSWRKVYDHGSNYTIIDEKYTIICEKYTILDGFYFFTK